MRLERLPIDGVKAEFLAALGRGPVVLSSPTGSGKSTQVPRWCPGPVLVIEPRRVACRSLAQRVAELEGVGLGAAVGYHVRDEKRSQGKTRILFATPGIVLRLMDALDRFRTIVVDEFHERGLEVDLLLALLLERLGKGSLTSRLVVMSATLDSTKIARHLGGQSLHAEGRTFPVSVRYLAGKALLPDVRGLEQRLLSALDKSSEVPGDVLAFLPGKGEIAACAKALAGRGGLAVMELHGGLSLDEQSRVFAPSKMRKVILATNVAETSLTVPGVGVVIDSGLVRQTRYHRDRGFLTLVPIAADSADQRAGRAGRTAAGVVYRLWSEAAQLETRTAPEIYRESLVPLVLAATACGADAASLPFVDPPKSHALVAAKAELDALGAFGAEGLSARGRRLFGLPLDPLLGRLLVEAEEQGEPGLMAAMIDLVAALAVDRPLFSRRAAEDESEVGTVESRCDVLALVGAVRGEARGVNFHVMSEIKSVRRRLRQAFGVEGSAGAVDRQRLARAVMAADRRVVHIARRRGRKLAWSNGGTEIEVSRRSHHADGEGIEAIAVLKTMALGLGGREVRVLATQVMPLPLSWVVEAGLGRERLARVDLSQGRLVARVERTYAGKVIDEREDAPQGALARQAISELFLAGRIFKSVRVASEENLESVALARRLVSRAGDPPYWLLELAGEPGQQPVDFESWVSGRLEQLGVESADDLELLEPEDLLYPAPAENLRAELDRAWPRFWTVDGVKYKVDYQLTRNEVVLRPVAGKPKKLPDAFFLPRFPGFSLRIEHKGTLHTLRA